MYSEKQILIPVLISNILFVEKSGKKFKVLEHLPYVSQGLGYSVCCSHLINFIHMLIYIFYTCIWNTHLLNLSLQ